MDTHISPSIAVKGSPERIEAAWRERRAELPPATNKAVVTDPSVKGQKMRWIQWVPSNPGRVSSHIEPGKEFSHAGLPADDRGARVLWVNHSPDSKAPKDDNRKETGKGV